MNTSVFIAVFLNAQYVKIYYILSKVCIYSSVDLFIFFNLMYAIRNNFDKLSFRFVSFQGHN